MKIVIRTILTGFVMLASVTANAAFIDGTMTVSGDYIAIASDSNDLTTVSDITLSSVDPAGAATLDFFTTVNFGTNDGSGGATANLSIFTPVNNFFTIGGWQLDLSTLIVESDSRTDFLHLSGTGLVSGNSFQDTNATWSFSAENDTVYSMTVTAVPVPAAAWLFGSGLIALAGLSRRKA